jgi:hypothetical protein
LGIADAAGVVATVRPMATRAPAVMSIGLFMAVLLEQFRSKTNSPSRGSAKPTQSVRISELTSPKEDCRS